MAIPFYIMLALLLFLLAAIGFSRTNPARLAEVLRMVLPALLAITGIVMTALGRAAIGSMLIMGAVGLYGAIQGKRRANKRPGQRSTVRTAAIEMELDHDTGNLEGVILAGSREGKVLRDLNRDELFDLCTELASDTESLQLLEAYLDSRFPGWREDANANARSGQGSPSGSGTMTKQEAYQILGLEEGASVAAIRKAHRRLMQRVHPDLGGSSFLAARINQAKDMLLSGH